jgi:hypothetical protein
MPVFAVQCQEQYYTVRSALLRTRQRMSFVKIVISRAKGRTNWTEERIQHRHVAGRFRNKALQSYEVSHTNTMTQSFKAQIPSPDL